MRVIGRLASAMGQNDEAPNIKLAEELAASEDSAGIAELAENLFNADDAIASDCIKVLYEVGYRKPELVAEYWESFIKLLSSKNNRMVWGAAIALANIAAQKHKELFKHLETIRKAYERGSVITVDNCVSIFAELAKADKKKELVIVPLLISNLETCRPKEVAQHAERAAVCINKENAKDFKATLLKRIDSLTEPQRKRVEKLLKKIEEMII